MDSLYPNSAIRALEGGVIGEIRVKEGDYVQQGDVLIVQDPQLPQAEVDRLEASAELIRQDIARLEAERTGQSFTGNASKDQLLEARLREHDTRRSAAEADARRYQAGISEAQARLARLRENLVNARSTLVTAQERERTLFTLVDQEGAVPRFDYLEAKDRLTQAEDQVSSLEQEIAAQQQAVQQAEQAYQASQRMVDRVGAERQSDILSQLSQRQEELANLEGQLNQARIRTDGQTITAPVAGRIYNLQTSMAERSVAPGEELMSILPEGQDLMLEVKILNRDIGFVQEGMPVKVKIATFPFQEFGTISGEVAHISPNAIVDRDLGMVFTARVQIDRTTVYVPTQNREVELVPGMTASAEVVTRQRSVLTFLLEPITRRFSEAFSTR
ncbi:HlyD family type I secretion periplasmic adaptor subunit [Egbenema bharatensis]|uniref:HlyD family type I secretion periplasmic adaptor subunit n=1 Tax=Egbenema bharatensis TaxID=3463334 RepID=UPI003A89A34E